ncbi:hypothetical protein [Streptomyces sp. NPDC017940]|uniref:hypothetical protein n=1 Tax=Streptomyces sp. NPDC017940 TaxID=3365017 RepID=UPI0037A3C611
MVKERVGRCQPELSSPILHLALAGAATSLLWGDRSSGVSRRVRACSRRRSERLLGAVKQPLRTITAVCQITERTVQAITTDPEQVGYLRR